jgi:hypothetical protein
VAAAPVPARIIEKGLVSDGVVVNTVVAKYCDHLPLYRQCAILEREAGVDISRATLDGWVMRVGELLIPIAEAMRRDLLGGSYIQADLLGALSGQRNYLKSMPQRPMQTAPERRSLRIIPLMARPADPSNGYESADPLQRRPRASGGPVVAEESSFSRVDHRLPAMDPALPYLLSTASSR